MKRLLLIFTCCSPLVLLPDISFALGSTISTAQERPIYKKYGPIHYYESLWSVSKNLRPNSSVSIQQTLLAIYKLNPNAFVASDINNFIENSIINVPTYTFIKKQSHQDAINLINNSSNKSKTATKSVVIAKSKKVLIIKSPSLSEQAAVTIVDPGDQSLTASLIDKKHLPDPNSSVSPATEYGNDQQNNLKADNVENILVEQSKSQLLIKTQTLEDELKIVNEQLVNATKTNEEFKLRLQQLINQIDLMKREIEGESAAQLTLLKLSKQSSSAQQPVINKADVNEKKGFLSNSWLVAGAALLLIIFVFLLIFYKGKIRKAYFNLYFLMLFYCTPDK
ncbi:Tfp pilus assembly protein FimV-like protein [Psychromonas ingrahamii 37]|uniref:Tfp pilus assembly protein FimV-like protein n=1 Tax=Psychromonas ingrahamii (strain DSM 17664 / CCUG 51855 / 37) TaxID=357804 RepID=A1SW92_PSYIN|nr:FimV/HubP family polar landmark protein [Psychromonas ingrahamii]ABM03757.1 Tfp pilus assembly protein FimV-like protein [Psychromonas ingrahamii 37]